MEGFEKGGKKIKVKDNGKEILEVVFKNDSLTLNSFSLNKCPSFWLLITSVESQEADTCLCQWSM